MYVEEAEAMSALISVLSCATLEHVRLARQWPLLKAVFAAKQTFSRCAKTDI
jgi:hypothetical protein